MPRHAGTTLAIGLLVALAAAACGGPTPPRDATPAPTPPRPTGDHRIAITSDESVIVDGDGVTVQFHAHVVDADGRAVPGAEVTWSSRAPDVVSVTADGRARSLASAGSAVLEARHADLPPAVANVVIGQARAHTVLVPSDAVRSVSTASAVLDANGLERPPVVGSVVVSGSRGGLLARVEAVEARGGDLHLRVSDAALADAFEQLAFDLTGPAVTVALPSDASAPATRLEASAAFACERGGSVVSVAMTGFSYQGGTATFEPYASGDLLAGQLELGIAGDVRFSVEVGRIDVAAGLQGQITCTAPTRPLGAQPARLRVGPITIGAAYDYTYGVDLTLSYDGPSLSVTGPSVQVEATFAAGLRIDGMNVAPVHHFEAGDGSRTSLGSVSRSENALSRRVELGIEPSLTFSQRLTAGIGRPDQGFQVTELRFLEASLYAGLDLAMDLPPDKDERGYVGPAWAIYAGARASLAGEVGLADLGTFLSRFLPSWIDLSADYGSVELFDVRLYREQASRGLGEASRALVLQTDEPVALTATFPAPPGDAEPALQPGDRIEFVSWRDDETEPIVIGTTALRGDGRAEYDWEPDLHEDRGRHTVVARAYARGYGQAADKPLTSEPVTVLVGQLVAEVEYTYTWTNQPAGWAQPYSTGSYTGRAEVALRSVHPTTGIVFGDAVPDVSYALSALACGSDHSRGFYHYASSVQSIISEVGGAFVRLDPVAGTLDVNANQFRIDRIAACPGYVTHHGTSVPPWTWQSCYCYTQFPAFILRDQGALPLAIDLDAGTAHATVAGTGVRDGSGSEHFAYTLTVTLRPADEGER